MPVHQDAKFSTNSKYSHDDSVKRIGRHLKGTNDEGLMLKPDLKKGLETHVDADFAGAYDNATFEDPSIFYSRTGLIIKHDNFLTTWKSKLQTEIVLSTTEAEHVALSTALKKTMLTIQLLRELHTVMDVRDCNKTMMWAIFEDNNGAIELAKTPKIRPRTKHVAIKY